MFQSLKLLLPALIPSWNFFDIIAPSPRIQFTLLNSEEEFANQWHEFRPQPTRVSFIQMLGRMFWNPRWNESLFLVSCAERIMQQDTANQIQQSSVQQSPDQLINIQHSETEILNRIARELRQKTSQFDIHSATHLQFRLLFIQREYSQLKNSQLDESQLQEEITFVSRIQALLPAGAL